MGEHLRRVGEEIGENIPINFDEKDVGVTIPLVDDEGGKIGVITFWRRSLRPIEVFSAGHEIVHVLEYSGLEVCLVDDLYRAGFCMNPFEMYSDREAVADVGGVLNCLNNKVDVPDITPNVGRIYRDMIKSRVGLRMP